MPLNTTITVPNALVETLAGASNSPRVSPLTFNAAAALAAFPFYVTSTPGITPYTVAFDRPVTWENGDQFRVYWATDYAFTTGVGGATVTLDAAVSAYTFPGMSALTGELFMKAVNLTKNYSSDIIKVGDTTAPVISSALAVMTNPERSKLDAQIVQTGGEALASIRITGGTDSALFEAYGTKLRWAGDTVRNYEAPLDGGTNNVYDVILRGTDLAGNESADFAIAVTVANIADTMTPNPAQPPIANATEGQTYTFSFGVAGYSGVTGSGPLTWTGPMTVAKNGVTITSPSTFLATDTFVVTAVGPAANVSASQVMNFDGSIVNLLIGGPATLVGSANFDLWIEARDTAKLIKAIDGTGAAVSANSDPIGTVIDKSPRGFNLTTYATGPRPLWKAADTDAVPYIEFDGIDDILYRFEAMGISNSDFTIQMGLQVDNSSSTERVIISEGRSAAGGQAPYFNPVLCSNGAANSAGSDMNNDAGTRLLNPFDNATPNVFNNTKKILTVTRIGSTLYSYVDKQLVATTRPWTPAGTFSPTRWGLGAMIDGNGVYGPTPMRLYGLFIERSAWSEAKRLQNANYMSINCMGGVI